MKNGFGQGIRWVLEDMLAYLKEIQTQQRYAEFETRLKRLRDPNTPCPNCGYLITTAEIKRVNWEEIGCPMCGESFDPSKKKR